MADPFPECRVQAAVASKLFCLTPKAILSTVPLTRLHGYMNERLAELDSASRSGAWLVVKSLNTFPGATILNMHVVAASLAQAIAPTYNLSHMLLPYRRSGFGLGIGAVSRSADVVRPIRTTVTSTSMCNRGCDCGRATVSVGFSTPAEAGGMWGAGRWLNQRTESRRGCALMMSR